MKVRKNKKNLKNGSRHLLAYINKGCNHCAWDYGFLFGVLEAKLHDMEDFFSSDENTHCANWKQVHRQIKLVRAVLNVALNEKLDDNCVFKFNTKNLDKDLKEKYDHIMNSEIRNLYFFYSYLYEIYREKALRLALRLIGKNYGIWWD